MVARSLNQVGGAKNASMFWNKYATGDAHGRVERDSRTGSESADVGAGSWIQEKKTKGATRMVNTLCGENFTRKTVRSGMCSSDTLPTRHSGMVSMETAHHG